MKRLDFFPGFVIREKQQVFNPFEERSKPMAPLEPMEPIALKPLEHMVPLEPIAPKGFSPLEPIEPIAPKPMASMGSIGSMASIPPKPLAPPKQIPFDQPRAADGQRLLYKYPNLPTVGKGTALYNLLVGSSDKSATAWLLQFDGAANPNPGPASAGAVLWSPQDAQGKRSPVFEMGKFIGKNTNNVAEIQGLLLGLKMAVMRNARDLLIEGDSELIINQQIGKYKVSHKNLKVWWSEIQAAMMDETCFDWIAIRHVYRECNERADSITKEVLSKKQSFTR